MIASLNRRFRSSTTAGLDLMAYEQGYSNPRTNAGGGSRAAGTRRGRPGSLQRRARIKSMVRARIFWSVGSSPSGEASIASAAAQADCGPRAPVPRRTLCISRPAEAEGNNCPRPRKEDSILNLQTSEPAPSVYANNRPCDEHYDSYDH
jgi:hypothetical protein